MAIKKTELYSSLWASANELRGGMDASEYKDYVLTLLFMKYVSDKYEADPDSLIEVPEGASFSDMVALAGDKEIGDKINKIIAKLAEANDLKNVIDTADFNDSGKLGTDKAMVDTLSKLVNIFDSLDLGANTAEGDDLLGDAYEFLMRHFATESGKSKGQFYTPPEVSKIMPQVLGIGEGTKQDETVYDPTCGSGSLLLKVAFQAPNGMSIYGQEKDIATTALCKMNMILHNNETAVIATGGNSTLAKPAFTTDNNTKLKTFDYVVANPPFSLKAWTAGVNFPDTYERFEGFDTPPEKNGDYAFLLHMIKSLKSKGKAAVILPHGVLFRGNTEGSIRAKLIKKGYIKGIIGLPANLFYGTGIPAAIIVIDKENASARSGIFMVDASKGFKKDGNKNRLRDQDVHKIVDTFTKQLELEKYSRMVPKHEIEENDFNLNIPRYIDSSEPEDLHNLFAHLNGGIPKHDVDLLTEYWDLFPDLKNTLFSVGSHDGYYHTNVAPSEVKNTILHSSEYIHFKENATQVYLSWREQHENTLFNLESGCRPKEIIKTLSESLLEAFKGTTLMDEYDVYQLLMDYYVEVMQDDLYLISGDGWAVGNTVRALTPSKNDKGKMVYKEVHDFEFKKVRYKADLIPPVLIIKTYFQAEQAAIDELQVQLDTATSELESFIEEHSGEDGLLENAMTDKGSITKTSVTKALKEVKDSEELVVIKQCKLLLDTEAKAKKTLKTKIDELNVEVFKKYAVLSVEEIKDIVIHAKWYASWSTFINDEIQRMTFRLANRVKTLEERYDEPLKEINSRVDELETKVEGHLKKMGLSW
jgi:type I restriction enzyme M protein